MKKLKNGKKKSMDLILPLHSTGLKFPETESCINECHLMSIAFYKNTKNA